MTHTELILINAKNSFNSFCPGINLGIFYFFQFFSPSSPILPSSCFFPWWFLLKTVTWHHLYCVFTYIYFLLIEKNLFECRNILVKFPCALFVYLCLSSEDLLIFSVRVSLFYSYSVLSMLLNFPFPCGLKCYQLRERDDCRRGKIACNFYRE